ncbi:MAG TPA: maleylpyruvate isomerase family mycothiol-dependent enzyme [Acidimicrobiia bacterium]|nr:maleylpyruvate isomerase family mycothiol-dependent enzyme [Acidimicrobiia bacterium]
MTVTSIDTGTIPTIAHEEAFVLAREAYGRYASVLAEVADEQWSLPTDCSEWTVRDMAGHMLGAMRSAASFREFVSQQMEVARRGRRDGRPAVDHMTSIQVERVSDLSPRELVAETVASVEKAARGRHRLPAPLRRWASFPVVMGDIAERWTLGYLVDVILTRDTFMHRVDLTRALGTKMQVDAEHEGRIVADVVAEWARRHGRPFTLEVTGPAGGVFQAGGGSEPISVDAIEFCRAVSGRRPGQGLLATAVPF